MNRYPLREILPHFVLEGDVETVELFGCGNINDTFKVQTTEQSYLLQRINHVVFPNPPEVMDNILRITRHIQAKLNGMADVRRHVLHFVPTHEGLYYHRDTEGNFWRIYYFVDDVYAYDVLTESYQAYEAARAFARFQNALADLPAPRLFETIQYFHNGPRRLEAFREAVRADMEYRAAEAAKDIRFVEERAAICSHLQDRMARGELPERIVHNDTKINNILLDKATNKAICVIDLDTVMPGLALFDFGDLVRSAASLTSEDETDLSKVGIDRTRFEAIVKGYLEEAPFLTANERAEMLFSVKYMVFVLGIRFLTDYLNGDVYFKTRHALHNLERARVQFRLLEVLEAQSEELEAILAQYQLTCCCACSAAG